MTLAELCLAVYSDEKFLDDQKTIVEDNMYAVWGKYNGSKVLVFRGTDDLKDWFYDLDVKMVKDSMFRGMLHEGFLNAYKKLRLDPFFTHADLRPDLVAGHSLGGALAVLASDQARCPCYTFGCPKVGDSEFAESHSGRVLRYVHNRDPVPLVPMHPFVHVGTEIKIGSWSIRSWFDPIGDHSMERYVKAYAP